MILRALGEAGLQYGNHVLVLVASTLYFSIGLFLLEKSLETRQWNS